MLDQYNKLIPEDLVLLNHVSIADISTRDWHALDELAWYCVDGNKTNQIFVSYEKAKRISYDINCLLDDADFARDLIKDEFKFGEIIKLVFIDKVLHRSDLFSGWYHA